MSRSLQSNSRSALSKASLRQRPATQRYTDSARGSVVAQDGASCGLVVALHVDGVRMVLPRLLCQAIMRVVEPALTQRDRRLVLHKSRNCINDSSNAAED